MALIITGSGSDTINGTINADLIYSGSGNDIVNAGDGSDIVYAGYGNDTVIHNVVQNLNDYDLYIGGAGTDTLRLLVTTAEMNAINSTNLVSAFMAASTTWLQYFNFGAYNSLLGFNLNLVVFGFENIEFVITDPVVNLAPTAVDAVYNTNEDASTVIVDLKTVMNVSDDAGLAQVHVQSVVFASGEAISYSVVGDTIQFDANQYNSLLASQAVNPVLNVTFVDAGGLTTTHALTLHVQGVNDAPVANADSFVAVDDSISSAVVNVGNLLSNDTDSDAGDTATVTAVNNLTVSGYGFSNALGLTDPIALSTFNVSNTFVAASYLLIENGVFANGVDQDAAVLTIFKDGHIELVKNSAFDFLPVGETLTISGSYTMQDAAGSMSSSTFSFNITGLDNDDVLVGTNNADVLNGGAGNDLIYGGLGADTIDGGAGINTVSYNDGRTVGVNVNLLTGVQTELGSVVQEDSLINIQNVTGTDFRDIITGDINANTILAGGGDDTIFGGLGSDIINGGAGIDAMLYSSDGRASGVRVNLATGAQESSSDGGATWVVEDTLSNIENVTGTTFDDRITGDAGDNVIRGGLGADIIDGGAGIDTVSYFGDGRAVGVTVNLSTGANTDNDVLSNIENVTGSNFNDIIIGNGGANTLSGGAGNDTLNGGAGNDILNAGGSVFNTSIIVDQTMTGGLGADTFVFDLNDGFFKTYVGDFRISESDKLEFIGITDVNNDGSKLDELDAIFGVGVTTPLNVGTITVFTAADGSKLAMSGASPVHLSDLAANIIFG